MGLDNVKSRIIEFYKGWAIVKHKTQPNIVFCYNEKLNKRSYDIEDRHGNNTLQEAIEKAKKYIRKQSALPSYINRYINDIKRLQHRKIRLIQELKDIERKEEEITKSLKSTQDIPKNIRLIAVKQNKS